jgi:hypothetical protein
MLRCTPVARGAAACIVVAVALAATAVAAPAQAAGRGDALEHALAAGRISRAQYAFERARSLFALEAVRRKYGDVARPGPRSATPILRDLAAALPKLPAQERRTAAAILARPTDGSSDLDGYRVARTYFRRLCTKRFCIHWVTRSSDAPSLRDRRPRNRIPDWIDKTRRVMNRVWNVEIADLGYRRPQRDGYGGHRGGNPNGKLDVFVADLGSDGLYGYCTTDDPASRKASVYRVAAYCVFDNDFSRAQFGGGGGATGRRALKVTAAHETHHAEQFNYDYREDRWFMEATATNMEAVVYPHIHDNYQFLKTSPLSPINPSQPIDEFGLGSTNAYGSWIFFRFLSEYFDHPTLDNRVVRRIWYRAADTRTSNGGMYSTEAIEAVLATQRPPTTFFEVFRTFGVVNARPAAWYKAGAGYPRPGATPYALTLATPRTVRVGVQHMATRYLSLAPPDGASTLNVSVNLPPGARDLAVTLLLFGTTGGVIAERVPLNAANSGSAKVEDFSPESTRKVLIVLTNGGTRFNCWTGRLYSCNGTPLDDVRRGRYFTFEAT